MSLVREAEGVASAPFRPAEQLRGTLRLPSDKSIAHRALMLDAVASGDSVITVRSPGEDVLSTASALRSLGASVEQRAADDIDAVDFVIRGLGPVGGAQGEVGRLRSGEADCGNSGTTMRLLAGLAAFGHGPVRLTGDASLGARPMERVAEPQRHMGAAVRTTDGTAPLVIEPARPLTASEYRLPVASAQLLGAICFAGLGARDSVEVTSPGPTRDHTERLLSAMGAALDRSDAGAGATRTTMTPPRAALRPVSMTVPGDISSAAAWFVGAAIHPDAELVLEGVGLNPTRTALIDVLREMGADVAIRSRAATAGGEPVGDLVVRTGGRPRAIAVGRERVPALIDELPLLAVAMAAADGRSEVRGAAELRVKESDRIAAMVAALRAMGADVDELPDGWRVSPGRPGDALVVTHGDHRIAIASAVAAFAGVVRSLALDDAACVSVSYPTFWRDAATVGALPWAGP